METPLRIPANVPEECITPLNSGGWQLQTSPEICMKRLLCRGYEKIFQISKCWRKDERGSQHLTEFTMLEWYRSEADYTTLMTDCEELLDYVSSSKVFTGINNFSDCNPALPARRISVRDAFSCIAGKDVFAELENGTFDEIISGVIEPGLADCPEPVILFHFPAAKASLARLDKNNPDFAERFELYLGGMEIANGFSELNDPGEQLKRFEQSNIARQRNGNDHLEIPEKFISELGSMPDSAGIALGVDRLVMFLTGSKRIDDVVAFTTEEL